MRKSFFFLDNSIWIGSIKLSQLGGEYLSPAVNVLRNSPKILPINKRDFFQLNFFHIDQNIR